MKPDDDEAWRGIVDHYGERIDLTPDVEPPTRAPEPEPDAVDARSWEDPDGDWSTDRFVPPPPPPVPATTSDRAVAWAGLFGAPVALLVSLIVGIALPDWATLMLVAAFVGGFVYLVVKMPREPRDPGDDGAVL